MRCRSASSSAFRPFICCRWLKALDEESKRLEEQKEMFMYLFTPKDFQDLRQGWESKKARVAKGLQFWGFFIAVKPANNNMAK